MAARKRKPPKRADNYWNDGHWKRHHPNHWFRHCSWDYVEYYPTTGTVMVNHSKEEGIHTPQDLESLIDHLTNGCLDPNCCAPEEFCGCDWCADLRGRQNAESDRNRANIGCAGFKADEFDLRAPGEPSPTMGAVQG